MNPDFLEPTESQEAAVSQETLVPPACRAPLWEKMMPRGASPERWGPKASPENLASQHSTLAPPELTEGQGCRASLGLPGPPDQTVSCLD